MCGRAQHHINLEFISESDGWFSLVWLYGGMFRLLIKMYVFVVSCFLGQDFCHSKGRNSLSEFR